MAPFAVRSLSISIRIWPTRVVVVVVMCGTGLLYRLALERGTFILR